MKLVQFKDLGEKTKENLNKSLVKNALKTRQETLKRYGKENCKGVYYCDLSYCKSLEYGDFDFVNICEICGTPQKFMKCEKDVPANYQQRYCIYKCLCGKVHEIYD